MIIKRKQIIKQGGSYVVTLSPKMMKDNNFHLGDIIDIDIEHNEEFMNSQQEQMFARMVANKMKQEGVGKLTFELKEKNKEIKIEQNEETKTDTI